MPLFRKLRIFLWIFSCPFAYNLSDAYAQEVQNIRIDERDSILVYYPNFQELDLACGKFVPSSKKILYCCAGAFTAKTLKYFSHSNIRCGHVCNGRFYEGSPEPICNGTFTFYNGKGHFAKVNVQDLKTAAANHGMGFCQVLIILNGQIIYADEANQSFWMKRNYVFRALCEKDGQLCIAESKEVVSYSSFVRFLKEYGFTNAIYLDMGGWSHAWYRNNDGKIVNTNAIPTRFATNWLLFKK